MDKFIIEVEMDRHNISWRFMSGSSSILYFLDFIHDQYFDEFVDFFHLIHTDYCIGLDSEVLFNHDD